MRENATTIWSELLVEGILVFNGFSLKPSFVSCKSGCMRAIIPGTGGLDCSIICSLI